MMKVISSKSDAGELIKETTELAGATFSLAGDIEILLTLSFKSLEFRLRNNISLLYI